MPRPGSRDAYHPDVFVPFERAQVEQSVPQRFAWQVERHASRLALRIGGESVTYGTLDRWSSRVATGILEALGPAEAPVALLVDSGVTHAVTQLGVLKAGKTCVPMDATYPEPRLCAILADAGTRVVLTDRAHCDQAVELCRSLSGVELFDVEAWVASAPDRAHRLDIAPSAIAYVLYTSGSTGEPKGVMQSHRNLLQLARVYGNGVELRPSDRLFCPMPLAYSGAVWALAASLLNGAALCRGAVPADVLGQLVLEDITVAQLMASMLRNLLLSATGEQWFPKLRLVFTGGEVLYAADVERFRAVFPGCRLLYDLGSTEAGIISLYRPVPSPLGGEAGSAPAAAQAVPAGYPVDDVDVLLLDASLAPVPDGAVGQIAVRSEFISPGYWRSADRTAARFVGIPPAPADPSISRGTSAAASRMAASFTSGGPTSRPRSEAIGWHPTRSSARCARCRRSPAPRWGPGPIRTATPTWWRT